MSDSPQTSQSCLRPMAGGDLALVLEWRNHPDIRRCMFDPAEIPADKHQRWFDQASADAGCQLLILEIAGVPAGFARIQVIGPGVAEWGFYAAPGAAPGTGRMLGELAIAHGFTGLGLRKLCGKVLASNERSLRFHERHGFVREGVLRQQHFDGRQIQDVVCFGLLAEEWGADPGRNDDGNG